MGGLYSRIKTWVSTEDVTYSDLNAEFDNVLTNFVPLMMDDYSANVTQMQVTTDPGEVGTESLATTLAGELARLRFMIKEITGESYWYESSSTSLAGLANAIGTAADPNRIVSGRVRTTSNQPIFLVPNGAARTVKLDGTPTNFIYYVEGTQYTISSDVTITGLTAAPSSNNTCLVNDAIAADQYWTKYSGEDGSEITIDTVGSEISALAGKLAGFKLDNGTTTEYFIAEVGTNKLIKAKRGYFFDSSDAPIPRIVFSNNDTITLMKLTWVYTKTDGTLTVSYTNPTYGKDEPSSPAANDYWYDTDNLKWKKYDVASFVDADATLIGICLQDTTNTVAARSFDFFASFDETNTVELMYESNTQVKSRHYGSKINVLGTTILQNQGQYVWDMTLDLESGVTEASSTYYYFYVTEEGDKIISDKKPLDRREDLKGFYHPFHSWRCVGSAFNNASSNLTEVNSYYSQWGRSPILTSQTAAMNIEVIPRIIKLDSSGGAFTEYLPPAAYWRGQVITLLKKSSDVNPITIDGFGSETINGATTTKINTQYEKIDLLSDGTEIFIVNRYIAPVYSSFTPTLSASWGTTSGNTAYYERIERNLFVKGVFTCGTTTAAAGTILLPLSLSIDTSAITNNTTAQNGPIVGHWQADLYPSGLGNMMTAVSTDATKVYWAGHVGVTAKNTPSANISTECAGGGNVIAYEFNVPIANWVL